MERWEWLGEPLGIDFANTVRRRGLEYVEYLDSPDALVEWAGREGLPLRVGDVGTRLDEARALRDAVFALLLDAVRENGAMPRPGAARHRAISRASATPRADMTPRAGATPRSDATPQPEAAARLTATPRPDAAPRRDATRRLDATPPSDVAARLNAALAAVPLVPQLRDGDVVLTSPGDAPALDELLARVAASALELLRDPALAFCDAPGCGQFFLRHRGDQRWCGPACGTRARVARHAAHHRRL